MSRDLIIGKCSLCHGDVHAYASYLLNIANKPKCINCGAVEDIRREPDGSEIVQMELSKIRKSRKGNND